jgi:hypothetical protein
MAQLWTMLLPGLLLLILLVALAVRDVTAPGWHRNVHGGERKMSDVGKPGDQLFEVERCRKEISQAVDEAMKARGYVDNTPLFAMTAAPSNWWRNSPYSPLALARSLRKLRDSLNEKGAAQDWHDSVMAHVTSIPDEIIIKRELQRSDDEFLCKCGGLAGRVKCTDDEIRAQSCGRNYECCMRAFVCEKCDVRFVGEAPAPSYDWHYNGIAWWCEEGS